MSLDKEVQVHLDIRKDLPTLSPASRNQSGKIKRTINWSEKSIGVCVIYSDFMFLESNIFFCLSLSFCILLWNYSGKTNSNNQMEGLNMIHVKLVWFLGNQVLRTVYPPNKLPPCPSMSKHLYKDFRGCSWMVKGPVFNSKKCPLTEDFILQLPTAIFKKSFFYAASLESHPFTQHREQGLPQGSISLLTKHLLEAPSFHCTL